MPLDRSDADRLLPWAELAGFAAAGAAIVGIELAQNPEYFANPRSIFAYSLNPETTWPAVALLAAPLVWWLGGRSTASDATGRTEETGVATELAGSFRHSPARSLAPFALSVVLFAVHVALAWLVGLNFRGMPPAYHDEYSYIFQANTFLAGRLYFPTHALPEFFDQMHVLNDGVFASRYFPGVGLWLAPWVAIGRPYWGQYLAGGLIVMCVFWIGRELAASIGRAGDSPARTQFVASVIGFAATMFCAVSPAMLLFGNLLLSHHPTMLGLAAFVICYFRALRAHGWGWPLVGGVALAFAMLCRPLTAFGFALPFGLHLVWLLFQGRLERAGARLTAALVPIGVGVAILAGYNAALTGSALESPYGKYTKIYSPYHVYGFYNRTRGEKYIGPKVLDNYNRWAEELTVPRSIELAATRASASGLWSLGRIGVPWAVGFLIVLLPWLPVAWRLLAGSVVGLHAVYFPFAFVGIYELSYVFESVPVLCVLVGGTAVVAARRWIADGRWGRCLWLAAFLLSGLHGPALRLRGGVSEVRYARSYYAEFERQLERAGVCPPAIVFIRPDPADRDRELVTNSPSLDAPILRVRATNARGEELVAKFGDLVAMYHDRQVWIYDARSNALARVMTDPTPPARNPAP